jgi:hypothetical protein
MAVCRGNLTSMGCAQISPDSVVHTFERTMGQAAKRQPSFEKQAWNIFADVRDPGRSRRQESGNGALSPTGVADCLGPR